MSLSIKFEVLDLLSYPMAHNRVQFISRIDLTNAGDDLDDAQVVVEVSDDEGPVSDEFVQPVVLPRDETVTLRDAPIRLDPAAFLQVRDPRPGLVTVSVRSGDRVLASASRDVTLLAGNQWLSRPPGLAYELLASFVMPNDPAIGQLLNEAAAILTADTGSPSMDGYQSGDPGRVDAVAKSIWDAAQRRGIRYAEPPSSWWEVGQKVRSPAEVLDGGVGTCLDTTVVLAAALEQAGLRPLLWVLDGHAFLGYWRVETSLDATTTTDATEVMNAVDLAQLRLIETTAVTQSDDPTPFTATHSLAMRHLQDGLQVVKAVIDVWSCRRIPIFPLPARRTTGSGVQIIEYRAAAHSPRQLILQQPRKSPAGSGAVPVPPRVQQWKNSLLDLSLRNRLINYSDRAGVRLRVPEGQLGQIEDLVHNGRPLILRPTDDIQAMDAARGLRSAWELPEDRIASLLNDHQGVYTDVSDAGYLTRMRNLAYKARTIHEETGANNLYLVLGSLRWSLDGRELRSPLILVPVNLTTRSRGQLYQVELDESGGSTPNYCLLEKLRQIHGLTIPALENPAEDESGIDLDAALRATRVALAERGIAARVESTADLSILQFAKFRLWKDLDEHWRLLSDNPLVRHLINSPTEQFVDPTPALTGTDLDNLDAKCPIPADASQLDAVAAATAGRTFVLEGPPGTGKSQTITNLLTRAVAEGRRVLFVAEKRAALDVVSARLDSIGMGPFCLDLHDKGSKPMVVRAQIKQALEYLVSVDSQELVVHEEDLRTSRRTLRRYAERLHETNPAGLSMYTARTSLLTLGSDGPALPVPVSTLTSDELVRKLHRALELLPDVADLAQPGPDHPWGFIELDEPDQERTAAILAAAARVDQVLPGLPSSGPLHDVLGLAGNHTELSALAALLDTTVSLGDLDAARSESWTRSTAALTTEIAAFVAAAHPGLDVATPAALDLPLADIHAQAQAAAASGFFRRRKRCRAVVERLQPTLRPGAQVAPRDVLTLTTALMQLQGAVRGLAGRASGVPGLSVPASWNPFGEEGRGVLTHQLEWLSWAGKAVDAGRPGQHFSGALRTWLTSGVRPDPGEASAVRDLSSAFAQLASVAAIDSMALSRWSGPGGLISRWAATARPREPDSGAQSLWRWCAFTRALQPLREAGLDQAADLLTIGQVHADEAVRAFDRGVAVASLAERRAANGFERFEGETHNRAVERFTAAVHEVRQDMITAIPAQVIEARSFRASTGRGQVGELQRELAKQRRGLGVRGLMLKYGELITQVMPCVLVSPDSVARFFPVTGQRFDLVVFDEASQIRVADAIGAMGRGASVVVVGDSKQMPPTSFAETKVGLEDDDAAGDDEAVEDEESILTEAVLARVPQHWLTWHYRSRDESLIAFSNAHYYESKLSSFPAPSQALTDRLGSGMGVALVRVNGTFRRSGAGKQLRTNPEEAAAIVAEIRTRFDRSPERAPSLGVVTFNQQQRAYIEALVRDSQDERLVEALDGTNGEGLFIKNLENVQGDERDVILFSTAFSVNDKGVLPLNFGPLTRAGGERRLNVAITRARRQVIVFSSFDPAQIRVEETQSKGIRHLRAYLELAAYGAAALDGSVRVRANPDRHRDEIATRLRAKGLIVRTGVGLSDFRVDLALADAADPERLLVAVLLDGPEWAHRRTVGDRDGLPEQVLGGLMQWPAVERIWLPSWLADPEPILANLVESVSDAKAVSRDHPPVVAVMSPPTTPAPQEDRPASALEPVRTLPAATRAPSIHRLLDGQQVFHPFVPRPRGPRSVLDELPNRTSMNEVAAVAAEVIEHEGPVHVERVARLVAASFGLTRLNSARLEAIGRAVPMRSRRDTEKHFAWPEGLQPDQWTSFRSVDLQDPRPLDHVALREIGNAMVALCRDAAGFDDSELASEALLIFGFKRRTAGITARLDQARDLALSRNLIHRGSSGRLEVAALIVQAPQRPTGATDHQTR